MIVVARICALAALLLVSVLPDARAELRIEIKKGVDKAIPIAVVPFGWQGTGDTPPFDVAGLITADLGSTGRFAPINPSDMLEKPTIGRDVDFQDWRIIGAEVVIVGRLVEKGPGNFSIQYQVFDVFRGEQLLGYRQPSSEAQLRISSHRVADMIYE